MYVCMYVCMYYTGYIYTCCRKIIKIKPKLLQTILIVK